MRNLSNTEYINPCFQELDYGITRMKIFQKLIKRFEFMGIHSEQTTKKHLFNEKNVFISIVFIASSLSAHAFFWFKARNFRENTDSFYETCCVTTSNINFMTVLFKMRKMFKFIENLENFILSRLKNPASKVLYENSNQIVEKWSNILGVSIMDVTVPFLMFPTFVTSCYNSSIQILFEIEHNKHTTGPSYTKSQALSHAADALRDILNKLPIHHTSTIQDDHHQNVVTAVEQKPETHDNYDTKPFEPYDIPSDPIPPFKPVKQLVTSYGVPISSPPSVTTHTQTITTAYGAPITDYQKPFSLVDSHWPNVPIGPGVSQPGLDIYHSMTLKLGNDHKKKQYLPPNPQQFQSQYPNAHYYETYGDELVKRQTNVQKIRKRGPDFEIQKSVAYELKASGTPQTKLIKVRRQVG